ncbi:MAG TPA: hypothetical protein DHM90_00755, partial [Clostridiaceae bacterium]|nr:hypothetical protein [Clostridiaceae bacterium]
FICKISFHLSVEGLIESDIMQLYTLDTVKEIVGIMMGEPAKPAEPVAAPQPKEEVYVSRSEEQRTPPREEQKQRPAYEEEVEVQ